MVWLLGEEESPKSIFALYRQKRKDLRKRMSGRRADTGALATNNVPADHVTDPQHVCSEYATRWVDAELQNESSGAATRECVCGKKTVENVLRASIYTHTLRADGTAFHTQLPSMYADRIDGGRDSDVYCKRLHLGRRVAPRKYRER